MQNVPFDIEHPPLFRLNPEEFGKLVLNHQNSVFRYFLVSTKNESLAEDYTQEVFYRAWKQRKKYDMVNSFSTWVFAIARNYLLDQKKREKLKTKIIKEIETKNSTEESDYSDLHEAIENLNDEERQIINMKYFEIQDSKTIADRMHKTPNAINIKLKKIREKLFHFLSNKNEE